MSVDQPKNPLHGVTLKQIVEDLVQRRGFEDLAEIVRIRCFTFDPSIQSSLKFLRRTPWARAEVEKLYIDDRWEIDRRAQMAERGDSGSGSGSGAASEEE